MDNENGGVPPRRELHRLVTDILPELQRDGMRSGNGNCGNPKLIDAEQSVTYVVRREEQEPFSALSSDRPDWQAFHSRATYDEDLGEWTVAIRSLSDFMDYLSCCPVAVSVRAREDETGMPVLVFMNE